MKLGKFLSKSNININEVLLLMIEHFETIQIVYCLPGGYMMDLKTTCHVSRVMCHMSHVTFQPFLNHKRWGPALFIKYSPKTMCHVSRVTS